MLKIGLCAFAACATIWYRLGFLLYRKMNILFIDFYQLSTVGPRLKVQFFSSLLMQHTEINIFLQVEATHICVFCQEITNVYLNQNSADFLLKR